MLGCALWSGACCEFLPKFDPDTVFDRFTSGDINLFMAVPTIYFKLIARSNELSVLEQEKISKALKHFRLMVSGSAALPVSVLEQWREISGHTLLERYGMTEMGMAISNPYRGERKPGFIGQALPGVQIRLADENGQIVPEGTPGEIQVKGPNVFSEYWGKPEETEKAFTADGWFLTGDIAVLESGSYRILGRNSVDIIKSGGYKISALEIEEVLRTHPMVKDCAVIGIPDDEWGEVVAAGIVSGNESLNVEEIRNWLKGLMPAYKLPRQFMELEELPRNVLGKVTKNALKDLFLKS
jgi:malonyl-CoA/methylmalonyl-CoA synthetase